MGHQITIVQPLICARCLFEYFVFVPFVLLANRELGTVSSHILEGGDVGNREKARSSFLRMVISVDDEFISEQWGSGVCLIIRIPIETSCCIPG